MTDVGGMMVRRGTPADADIFAAMIMALSAEEGVEPPSLTPDRYRHDGFGKIPRFEPLVAEAGGRVAGVAILSRGYDSQTASAGIILEDLYVEPLSRRHGIGRALMAEAARLAAAEGGGWVSWHVRRENTRAQLFYRALGAVGETVDTMAVAGRAFIRLAGG